MNLIKQFLRKFKNDVFNYKTDSKILIFSFVNEHLFCD